MVLWPFSILARRGFQDQYELSGDARIYLTCSSDTSRKQKLPSDMSIKLIIHILLVVLMRPIRPTMIDRRLALRRPALFMSIHQRRLALPALVHLFRCLWGRRGCTGPGRGGGGGGRRGFRETDA